jgi:hypothetical protein
MVKREGNGSSLGIEGKPKKRLSAQEREEILVENFVGLQNAMTNLSIKFSALSDNINKLLQIFEESAKSIELSRSYASIEKNDKFEKTEDVETNREMIKKIDSLLEQNKTIAQGLVIMEEKLRSKPEKALVSHEEDYEDEPKRHEPEFEKHEEEKYESELRHHVPERRIPEHRYERYIPEHQKQTERIERPSEHQKSRPEAPMKPRPKPLPNL